MHKVNFCQNKIYKSLAKGCDAQAKDVNAKIKKLVLELIKIRVTKSEFLQKIKNEGKQND